MSREDYMSADAIEWEALELEPLAPESIKDQIVRSVCELGTDATKQNVLSTVSGNDAIVSVAFGALMRDGYLQLTSGGIYLAHPTLAPISNAGAIAATATTQSKPEVHSVETQSCNNCNKPKPLSEFYTGAKKCKRCVLDAQTAKRHAKKGSAPAPKKYAATPKAIEVAAEFVLPAESEVRCTFAEGMTTIQQDDAVVTFSPAKAKSLHAWLENVVLQPRA